MAIFAISDLHLSFNCDKPMEVFGNKWENYTERMKDNWNKIVGNTDTVIIPGDISWATYIEDAVCDFEYINNLNGKKLIFKGNHDYWWTTSKKMDLFLEKNGFNTISIIQNKSVIIEDTAICGTRGWTVPASLLSEDGKIFERERQRLVLSLEDAKSKNAKKIIAAIHYPPCSDIPNEFGFTDILKAYNVSECVFGHLHGNSHIAAPSGTIDGIKMHLVSCDYLGFTPLLINR